MSVFKYGYLYIKKTKTTPAGTSRSCSLTTSDRGRGPGRQPPRAAATAYFCPFYLFFIYFYVCFFPPTPLVLFDPLLRQPSQRNKQGQAFDLHFTSRSLIITKRDECLSDSLWSKTIADVQLNSLL